jgi:hypothetical protein
MGVKNACTPTHTKSDIKKCFQKTLMIIFSQHFKIQPTGQHTGTLTMNRNYYYVTFEVFMAVKIIIMFFWFQTLCELVGRSQHSGEASCLQLQAEVISWDSRDYTRWQGGKSEGKGQSGWSEADTELGK